MKPICKEAKKFVKETTIMMGCHEPEDCQYCVMELASQVEMTCHLHPGAKWGDNPKTVDPVIKSLCIALNDEYGDAERVLLKPYALKTLGTKGSEALSLKRKYMMQDWVVRSVYGVKGIKPITNKRTAAAASEQLYYSAVDLTGRYDLRNILENNLIPSVSFLQNKNVPFTKILRLLDRLIKCN